MNRQCTCCELSWSRGRGCRRQGAACREHSGSHIRGGSCCWCWDCTCPLMPDRYRGGCYLLPYTCENSDCVRIHQHHSCHAKHRLISFPTNVHTPVDGLTPDWKNVCMPAASTRGWAMQYLTLPLRKLFLLSLWGWLWLMTWAMLPCCPSAHMPLTTLPATFSISFTELVSWPVNVQRT